VDISDPSANGVKQKSPGQSPGKTDPKIPVGVKIAYGGAEGASSLLFTVVAIYFLIFLTDVVGMSPRLASLVLFASNAWDALADPFMGVITDRTKSKYGRRRPYLLGIALPFALIFWLIFTTPHLHGPALFAYFLVMSILMRTAITVLDVPYTALAPEMTKDYDERTSLVSYRTVWSQVTSIIGATMMPLVVRHFSDPKTGWSAAGAFFGAICILPILLTWRFTRGWERYSADLRPLNLKDMSEAVFGNRTFRYVIGIYLFCLTAIYASGAVAPYFLQYWMNFSEGDQSIFFGVLFTCTIVWVPLIALASNKLGKRAALIIFMGSWALTYGVGALLVQPGQKIFLYILAALASGGVAAAYQLTWAIIPDVVEIDEFKTGARREGLYYGVAIFIQKTGSAVSLLIVGQILGWIGYVPNAAQSSSALFGIRMMFGPLIATMLIFSIILAYFMPMTRDRHRALVKAIEQKRANLPYDDSGFRDLL